jgi:hypothetical protein
VNGNLDFELEEVNGKVDAVIFWLITASMVCIVKLGRLGGTRTGHCRVISTFFYYWIHIYAPKHKHRVVDFSNASK